MDGRMRKYIQPLEQEFKSAGVNYTVDESGKHLKFIYLHDGKEQKLIVPKTPSDHRGSLNNILQLRRALGRNLYFRLHKGNKNFSLSMSVSTARHANLSVGDKVDVRRMKSNCIHVRKGNSLTLYKKGGRVAVIGTVKHLGLSPTNLGPTTVWIKTFEKTGFETEPIVDLVKGGDVSDLMVAQRIISKVEERQESRAPSFDGVPDVEGAVSLLRDEIRKVKQQTEMRIGPDGELQIWMRVV